MDSLGTILSSSGQFLIDYRVIITVFSSLASALLIGSSYYYKNKFSYWKERGINGPKPVPVFGNLFQLVTGNWMERETEWTRDFGKVYGIFQGTKPVLNVADAETIRLICIKEFDVFTNHENRFALNKYQRDFIFTVQDEKWKRIRTIMSPTFTSGKIRRMFKLLDTCADDLVKLFGKQLQVAEKSPVVNVKVLYELYTLDAISTCCYGLKLENCESTNEKAIAVREDFVQIIEKFFAFNYMRFLIFFVFNLKFLKLVRFELFPLSVFTAVADRIGKLIQARKQSSKKFDDYLQLLIDAKLDDKMQLDEVDLFENHHANLTHESLQTTQKQMFDEVNAAKSNKLTDSEILANAMLLMAVGRETTAGLLTACTYALAFHQDIQQRLFAEVEAISVDGKFDYDTLTSCSYLDSVVSESLRRLTPIMRTDRICKRDFYLEKYKLTVPAGSTLNMSLYAAMNDPDNWTAPDKFDPERFMPENRDKIVAGSYCPFGIGPRHCVGMRFSLTEAKLALAKIVLKYRFEPAPGTRFPPVPERSFGLNRLKEPIVRLIARDSQPNK